MIVENDLGNEFTSCVDAEEALQLRTVEIRLSVEELET